MTDWHVVYGIGPIGAALIEELRGRGLKVRAISRARSSALPEDVEQRCSDAANPDFATDVAEGAVALYQCMSPAYHKWGEFFPPLQRAVAAAAHNTGARLVSMENVYMYGDTDGEPMTEATPFNPNTKKGRIRAIMAEELAEMADKGYLTYTAARASDYFGPRGFYQSVFGARVIVNAFKGRSAKVAGNPSLPHSYSYTRDIAKVLATLGTDDRALGQVWHVPNAPAESTLAIIEMIREAIGRSRLKVDVAGPGILRFAGLFNPSARELVEMLYQFEKPFIVDGSKFERTFGIGATPLRQAIWETVKWWRGETEPDTAPEDDKADATPADPDRPGAGA